MNNTILMNEQLCWQLIEAAWASFPPLNQTRKRAISLNNATALEQLGLMLDRLIAKELEKQLQALSKEDLLDFIRFFERELLSIHKTAVPQWSAIKESDLHLALIFAIGMGQNYFYQIKRQPNQLHIRLQSTTFAVLPYTIFEHKFGTFPKPIQRATSPLILREGGRSSSPKD